MNLRSGREKASPRSLAKDSFKVHATSRVLVSSSVKLGVMRLSLKE